MTNGNKRPPATTPERREKQLAAAAYDLAARQLADGTASAQVITHFLKAGSTREVLEKERIAHEVELMRVKAENLERQESLHVLMGEALDAMRSYRGGDVNVSETLG